MPRGKQCGFHKLPFFPDFSLQNQIISYLFTGRFGKHGLAINLVDGPQTLEILRQIETHFGKPIQKLDAEDVDEIEKIQKN